MHEFNISFSYPHFWQANPDPSHGRAPRALIMSPTRELAKQIGDDVGSISTSIRSTCFYGGSAYGTQVRSWLYMFTVNCFSIAWIADSTPLRTSKFYSIYVHPCWKSSLSSLIIINNIDSISSSLSSISSSIFAYHHSYCSPVQWDPPRNWRVGRYSRANPRSPVQDWSQRLGSFQVGIRRSGRSRPHVGHGIRRWHR